MKKNLILWGTALILVLVALYVTMNYNKENSSTSLQSPPAQVQNSSAQNISSNQNTPSIDTTSTQKAIDFTLSDLKGNKVSLKDLKGKNVYINFWATWCPYCVKELPDIEKVYQEYKDKGLAVLAINIGEDKDTVQSFITKNNYHFTVLLDSDKSVTQAYGIDPIPVSIFIDKNGNIAAGRVGELSEAEMQSYIKQLLGK